DLVAVAQLRRRVLALRRDLAVHGHRGVEPRDLQESEEVIDGDPRLHVHRLAVDGDDHLSSKTRTAAPLKGAAVIRHVVFPSPALPGSGSRGPGPHPVLRNPPPTTNETEYIAVRWPRLPLARRPDFRATRGRRDPYRGT